MPTELRPRARPEPQPEGFRVTGRFVLIALLCFFGMVIGVNAIMAKFAISTFGGVETESAYKAGQAFKAESAAARDQAARNWMVDAKVTRHEDGLARVEVRPTDSDGAALTGLILTASLRHPTHALDDETVPMLETAPGVYTGTSDTPAGQWNLRLDLSRGGERMFRSESRLMLN